MIDLARSITDGRYDPDGLAGLTDEEAVEHLRGQRGVGRWTAEYVLLRGLWRTNIFPGDDVGARNNLRQWLHLAAPLDYECVRRTLARWRRFGGLIYFHLLLDRLETAGYADVRPGRQTRLPGMGSYRCSGSVTTSGYPPAWVV
jgi:DNA-3-methyladenine glycosylase II